MRFLAMLLLTFTAGSAGAQDWRTASRAPVGLAPEARNRDEELDLPIHPVQEEFCIFSNDSGVATYPDVDGASVRKPYRLRRFFKCTRRKPPALARRHLDIDI